MRTIAQKYIDEGETKLVKTMIANGVSIEQIAKMTKMSIARINEVLKISA
ncbi:MAG: hypothetical protein RCG15_04600 [Candidatus Rickettsia vulgarisii]